VVEIVSSLTGGKIDAPAVLSLHYVVIHCRNHKIQCKEQKRLRAKETDDLKLVQALKGTLEAER
jgi:hypothetical protein